MTYRYVYDILFSRDYVRRSETYEGFLEWLDEWVYECESPRDYCEKVGWERLKRLTYLERIAGEDAP